MTPAQTALQAAWQTGSSHMCLFEHRTENHLSGGPRKRRNLEANPPQKAASSMYPQAPRQRTPVFSLLQGEGTTRTPLCGPSQHGCLPPLPEEPRGRLISTLTETGPETLIEMRGGAKGDEPRRVALSNKRHLHCFNLHTCHKRNIHVTIVTMFALDADFHPWSVSPKTAFKRVVLKNP